MRVSVDMQLSRRDIQRLRRLDRALDRMQRKAERTFKGIGDAIAMGMIVIGMAVFMLGIAAADFVPTESLGAWVFITLCGLLGGIAGSWLLRWMRS